MGNIYILIVRRGIALTIGELVFSALVAPNVQIMMKCLLLVVAENAVKKKLQKNQMVWGE